MLAGSRLSREAPEVVAALGRLEGGIDVERIRAINRLVDEDHLSLAAAAERFLADPQPLPSRSIPTAAR